MAGRPLSKAKRIENLRKQLAVVLRGLHQEIPTTHLGDDPPSHCSAGPVREPWRRSLASAATALIDLGGLVDALARQGNGSTAEFDDERDCDFALGLLDNLDVEFPRDIQRERSRWRDELIRIVNPERIRMLVSEYPGDAGEKPLRNAQFCEWAVERVRSGAVSPSGRGRAD